MPAKARLYHHGDLRTALIDAGLQLARDGGPAALGIRELTRSVGVSPNAAYRHFTDRRGLVLAVADQAQDLLAKAMQDRMDAGGHRADPAQEALQHLRAVGLGYIDFALSEPGWFELAFLTHDEPGDGAPIVTTEGRIPPPFRLLLDALDELVQAGVLASERRTNAEWTCWSAVHGFAELGTSGPLRGYPRAVVDQLAATVVDNTVNGIIG